MPVQEKTNRRRTRFTRGGIGSYGNYPRDVHYDHDSFLAEMVSISIQPQVENDHYGLMENVFGDSAVAFPRPLSTPAKKFPGAGLQPRPAGGIIR